MLESNCDVKLWPSSDSVLSHSDDMDTHKQSTEQMEDETKSLENSL